MRLAKKELMSVINQPMCFGSRLVGKKMFAQIIKELCEYKTIEEELGIDLITLFRALNNPIYIKENYDGTIVDETLWCSNCIICGIGSPIIKVGEYCVYPKEYRKTWALRKEDLQ